MKLNWKINQTFFLVGLCFIMAGCVQNTAPVITDPTSSGKDPAFVPAGTTTPKLVLDDAPAPATPAPACSQTHLETAVRALQAADSFKMTAHEVVAYRIDLEEEGSRTVYGEFITTYEIFSSPQIKIRANHKYRYDPTAGFDDYQTYFYEQGGTYYKQTIEAEDRFGLEEIDREVIEPFDGDVFQTLTAYYPEAQCLNQDETAAVYVLQHPKWYTLQRGIGFADLGMLDMQEGGDSLIEQYVSDHYPEVAPIRFLIYVSRDTGYITKVVVDDRVFMESVWEAVNQALRESGRATDPLPVYQVLEDHRMEYEFSEYGRVADFGVPKTESD